MRQKKELSSYNNTNIIIKVKTILLKDDFVKAERTSVLEAPKNIVLCGNLGFFYQADIR